MLSLYRAALALRRRLLITLPPTLTWLETEPGVMGFARGDGFACFVNFTGTPVPLPAHAEVLLASEPLADGLLAVDGCAWVRLQHH